MKGYKGPGRVHVVTSGGGVPRRPVGKNQFSFSCPRRSGRTFPKVRIFCASRPPVMKHHDGP